MKKHDSKEILKKGNSIVKEFKQFISRGNVMDMAVGVIIGSAFGKIVSSIVDDILMPLIGVIIGGLDFSNLTIKVSDVTIRYLIELLKKRRRKKKLLLKKMNKLFF